MATSDPAGPATRWLTSTKNIAGLSLAVVAVLVQLFVGLGVLWPVVMVAAYGLGALLAPGSRVGVALGIGSTASPAELESQLGALEKALGGRRLEADLQSRLGTVLQNLHDVVEHWHDLDGAPDQQHTVQQMIADYLPTSVQTYLDLPTAYAVRALPAGQRNAHDELLDQLALLDTESGRIRDAVYARTVDALSDQGRFLREKFRKSSLDLGPGPGTNR